MNSRIKIVILIGCALIVLGSVWYVQKQFKKHAQAPTVIQDDKDEMLIEVVEEQVSLLEANIFDDAKTELSEKVTGTFNAIDFIHKGSGDVIIHMTTDGPLMTFKDFKVTNGPDLFVYLSKNYPQHQNDDLGEFINLGKLQNSEGEQSYVLPQNYKDYQSVVIWCRAFGVLFSSAMIQ